MGGRERQRKGVGGSKRGESKWEKERKVCRWEMEERGRRGRREREESRGEGEGEERVERREKTE